MSVSLAGHAPVPGRDIEAILLEREPARRGAPAAVAAARRLRGRSGHNSRAGDRIPESPGSRAALPERDCPGGLQEYAIHDQGAARRRDGEALGARLGRAGEAADNTSERWRLMRVTRRVAAVV